MEQLQEGDKCPDCNVGTLYPDFRKLTFINEHGTLLASLTDCLVCTKCKRIYVFGKPTINY